MKKKGGDLICMRPDSIIEARFNLTKKQNDILDMVFATIENDDKLQYEIDVAKYSKLYKMQDKSNVYGDLKKAVKTFEGKGFAITQNISEKKQTRIYFAWFSSIQYIDGEGKIIVELGQTLKKLLLEVKRAIYYKLEYSVNFNCIYSKRLYYYLKLYEDTGTRIDNLDTLRDKLECPKSYAKYANFRRFVLEPAQEEINGSSDITFDYKEQFTKNKVTSIKFSIKLNKTKDNSFVQDEIVADKEETPLDSLEERINNTMAILENMVNPSEALSICGSADGNMELISKAYEYVKSKKKTDNFVGYIIDTIERIKKGTFNEPKSTAKTGFNNFEPRNKSSRYSYLEEQCLLGQATEEERAEFNRMRGEA